MEVYVVVGVWSGCIQDVSVWACQEDAENEAQRLRQEYGIQPGQEAESEHAVDVVLSTVRR